MTELPISSALIPDSLFSKEDRLLLMARLWTLLAQQTEKYTMGDSTSVTVETAQELLTSLWYTLTTAVDDANAPYKDLLTGDLRQIVKQGQTLLQHKVEQVKRLWDAVCRTAPEIPNYYYTDTLRGIGDYFKRYDLYFFAHQKPPCIDYPLLINPTEALQGITYAEQYLKHMLIENRILRQFDSDAVTHLLRTVSPSYPDSYMNLCEQPLTNALGLALLGESARALRLGKAEQQNIVARLQCQSHENKSQLLLNAVHALCSELRMTDSSTTEYLLSFAAALLPRLEVAADSGNLPCIFIAAH